MRRLSQPCVWLEARGPNSSMTRTWHFCLSCIKPGGREGISGPRTAHYKIWIYFMWVLLKQPQTELTWSAQIEAALMDLLFLHVAWNLLCRGFILIPHLFSNETYRTDAILGQPVWGLCVALSLAAGSALVHQEISPAPSAPPLAGRAATGAFFPGAFFCIIHKPKISKFLSSLHTSSYQVLPELMLPSFKGVC